MTLQAALTLCNPLGVALGTLNGCEAFEVSRAVNNYGALTVTLPYSAVDYGAIKRDGFIVLERIARAGLPADLFAEQLYLIVGRRRWVDKSGAERVKITAFDLNCLLARRFVLYAAGSSQADKSGAAGDVLRAIVRENLGSSAAAARQLATLTVGADLGDGATVSKGFAWRNCLTVMREIAQASATAGTYLAFDLVCTRPPARGLPTIEFRTYAQQRGADHRNPAGTSGPVLIGDTFGNLQQPDYSEDWAGEVNSVTALGNGQGSERATVSASDAERLAASAFALSEGIAQTSGSPVSAAALSALANSALRAGIGRRMFKGQLVSLPISEFGVNIGFGDFVTAQAWRDRFDCRLDGIRWAWSLNDGDSVDAYLVNDSAVDI